MPKLFPIILSTSLIYDEIGHVHCTMYKTMKFNKSINSGITKFGLVCTGENDGHREAEHGSEEVNRGLGQGS